MPNVLKYALEFAKVALGFAVDLWDWMTEPAKNGYL